MQTRTTSYLTAAEAADALVQAQQHIDMCWFVTDRAQQEVFDQGVF